MTYLLVVPPLIVPLVDPLLMDPPVLDERPVWPDPDMVPLVEPLSIEPDVPLLFMPVLFDIVLVPVDPLPLSTLPGMFCLPEPIGAVALTPLLVEVAESFVCAKAIPEETNAAQKTEVINKRDMMLSPKGCMNDYLFEQPVEAQSSTV